MIPEIPASELESSRELADEVVGLLEGLDSHTLSLCLVAALYRHCGDLQEALAEALVLAESLTGGEPEGELAS